MRLDHVELDRTFRVLPAAETDAPADELTPGFGAQLSWRDLLSERRVVLLSEAGSGKTEEIRHTARRLLAEGRAAFFMRLEFVAEDFERAFEEGSFAAFEAWLASADDGWLFLDSVDEARLRSPKDFEIAIRRVGDRLKAAIGRVHVVITSRATAWRPISDLQLCRRWLPLSNDPPTVAVEPDGEEDAASAYAPVGSRSRRKAPEDFKVVTLTNLDADQIERFALGRGVTDPKAMLDAIERGDAWSFAARPQDLSEVVTFWTQNHRIGSRLELMRASIDRRLMEWDPDRSEARPLAKARAQAAVRILAGAATLTGQQAIEVADARTASGKGLAVADLLPDWNEADLAVLLGRPIFDDEIYGAVRFHHRSVREYLTAEWLTDLLKRQTSRQAVEQLFFQVRYGLEVVVPTLRPILPWLVLLDDGIRQRVARLAPEIFFEGGDPSQLPLATRRAVLRDVCDRIAAGAPRHSVGDHSAVQRFALPDLADDVASLIDAHADNEDILWILLRMVWQGPLRSVLPQALRIAGDPKAPPYVRIAAFRAVGAAGTAEDIAHVRDAFADEPGKLKRDWLAELLSEAPRTIASADWLVRCLGKTASRKPHTVDGLEPAVADFVREVDLPVLVHLIQSARPLLAETPVIERRHCEVSERFAWLLAPLALAAVRLAEARDPTALGVDVLDIFQKLPAARDYGRMDRSDIKVDLESALSGWTALRLAFFWRNVEQIREEYAADDKPLTDVSPALQFEAGDFDLILGEVTGRDTLDDQKVALSLAFRLYVGAGRPRAWRTRLHRAVGSAPELAADLHARLHPGPLSDRVRRLNRSSSQWQRRNAEREARQTRDREKSRQYLSANIHDLRTPGLEPGVVSQAQLYLFEAMRKDGGGLDRYSISDWRNLIPEFGEGVARAFRDGVVESWRRYAPPVLSQGAEANSIPYSAMIGLTGLAIEAAEVEDWTARLSASDVETAFRHAMFELNGMPPWLPQLFAAFPEQVAALALTELLFELDHDDADRDSHYLLHDLNWSGQWLWEAVAPALAEHLVLAEPRNLRNLRHVLNIVLGSSLSDVALAVLARDKAMPDASDRSAIWFAVWVTVDPAAAIPALDDRITGFPDKADRLRFAMTFLVHLVGGRRTEGFCRREAFRTSNHLKALYLLAHTHVRLEDDLHRAGTGVYSPILRDDAQDARDTLFRWLQEIPGKDTFLALLDIGQRHPTPSSRPWFKHHARSKAEADSMTVVWTVDQVRDFHATLDRTPTTHRALYDLTVMRLMDLKADLEDGDSSEAAVLRQVAQEVDVRKYLGNRLRMAAGGRYVVPQEEELADAKRPDLRFHGVGFDAPVPIELKLADNWSGPALLERLENQLCGDYLRDGRSSLGVFVLVYRGDKTSWEVSPGCPADFDGLVLALAAHWAAITHGYAKVDDIRVVGIDLTRRER